MIKSSIFSIWLATVIITAISGCVPVHPSAHDLVGVWQVKWACGTERIELRADATFSQTIEYAGGDQATHHGTWTVERGQSRLEGAKVTLKDSMEFCSVFGDKLSQPEQTDRRLETIWEWGRLTLSFNPDVQGFERQ